MSFKVTLETVLSIWEQLDCSTSLRLTIMVRYDEWAEVLATKAEPEHFLDANHYARANAAICILKKFPDIPGFTDEMRESAARATWFAGEASCYNANERLNVFLESPLSADSLSEFLRQVRRKIISWLGKPPDDDELKTRARHGPGTTFSSSVANPTAADKYEDAMTVTPDAVIHLLNLAGTKWMDLAVQKFENSGSFHTVVRGNRHAFAPKDALTFRNIGIEASVNMYFQLAVGSSMRSRLRSRAGWDLDNAASVHREMARRGSVDGSLATIDLTNASDSLCSTLVRVLLRDTGWLSLLEDLRSTHTCVDGVWHRLEKFSSMGNGYTFELESCVFAAIAAVSLELNGQTVEFGRNFGVFGDDIVVPMESAKTVVAALEWCGFKINARKTFLQGSFRESCGGDYFLGEPVRGLYLKQSLTKANHQRTFITINGIRKLFMQLKLDYSAICMTLIETIPSHLRLGGPDRLGDSVLQGYMERWNWSNGIRWLRVVRWVNPVLIRWSYFSPEARLACRLTGYGDTRGINTRGGRVCQEVMWVSDS